MLDNNQISSLISITVAVIVLGVSLLKWWDITYNGKMLMKFWVKFLLMTCIIALIVACYLLLLE